jgi:hypothetical protein
MKGREVKLFLLAVRRRVSVARGFCGVTTREGMDAQRRHLDKAFDALTAAAIEGKELREAIVLTEWPSYEPEHLGGRKYTGGHNQ